MREVTLRGSGMMLIAAEGVFHGIRFRELSISVEQGEREALLLQAFNSNRFFAWCERTFFHTPYVHAGVQVQTEPPSIAVGDLIRAEMLGPREPASAGEESWIGTVHLPRQRKFHAELSGFTRRYAFADRFETTLEVLQGFRPAEWIVREDATHRKSKTHRD